MAKYQIRVCIMWQTDDRHAWERRQNSAPPPPINRRTQCLDRCLCLRRMPRSIAVVVALGLFAGCGASDATRPATPSPQPTSEPAGLANGKQKVDPAEPDRRAEVLARVELPSEPPEDLPDGDIPTLRYTLDPRCKGQLSVLEGVYVHQFEISDFAPDNTDHAVYWVRGTTDAMDRLTSSSASAVKLRGKLSAPGKHGHLGGYEYELYVCEVLMHEPLCKTPKGPKLCSLLPRGSE